MRKLVGFVFGQLGKLILLALVVLLSGVLYVGAYFYQKSGEPMTVPEAQQHAPGLTFRDFWVSRVEQWEYWDAELKSVDKGSSCKFIATGVTIWRSIIATPFVLQMRAAGQDNLEYYNQIRALNNNAIPSPEILYDAPLLDAAWTQFEIGGWWAFANNPGSPSKALNQRRACSTQYPTPADVSANQLEASDSP